MPCSSRKARTLLNNKKACVAKRTPFTIKLLHGSAGYKQPITLGVDAGSRYVGLWWLVFSYVLILALLSHLRASNSISSSFLYRSQCKSLAESSFYLKLLVNYLKVFQVKPVFEFYIRRQRRHFDPIYDLPDEGLELRFRHSKEAFPYRIGYLPCELIAKTLWPSSGRSSASLCQPSVIIGIHHLICLIANSLNPLGSG